MRWLLQRSILELGLVVNAIPALLLTHGAHRYSRPCQRHSGHQRWPAQRSQDQYSHFPRGSWCQKKKKHYFLLFLEITIHGRKLIKLALSNTSSPSVPSPRSHLTPMTSISSSFARSKRSLLVLSVAPNLTLRRQTALESSVAIRKTNLEARKVYQISHRHKITYIRG